MGRQCWTQAANPSPGKALVKDAFISPFHGSHLGCSSMAMTLALSACVWASKSTKASPPSSTGRDITNLEGRPLRGGPPSSTSWLRTTSWSRRGNIGYSGDQGWARAPFFTPKLGAQSCPWNPPRCLPAVPLDNPGGGQLYLIRQEGSRTQAPNTRVDLYSVPGSHEIFNHILWVRRVGSIHHTCRLPKKSWWGHQARLKLVGS